MRPTTWFEYLRTSNKHKEELNKFGKRDVPFNIDGLDENEQRVVIPYYTEKQPLNTLPMFLEDVPDYGLSWIEDNNRSSPVARTKCNTVYYGQRKLLVNEMLFLALYGLRNYPEIKNEGWIEMENNMPHVPEDKNTPLLVYAGAGSGGQHLLYLCKLFSGVMFYCYDLSDYDMNLKNECKKGKYPNVVLVQTMFTEKERDFFAMLSNDYNVYFMSDIRSAGKKESFEEKEHRVDVDNQLQYDWVEKIRPVVAHLKWRTPYTLDETKIMTPSVLMLEPWSGPDSGELRQMIERPPKGEPYRYDTVKRADIETRLVTINNILKQYAHYKHPLPCSGYFYYDEEEKTEDVGIGLDHCWSCTYELMCWCIYMGYDYAKMRSANNDVLSNELSAFMKKNEKTLLWYFNMNTRINCRTLNINCHGMMPEKTSYEKYLAFTEIDGKEHSRFVKNFTIRNRNIPINLDCPYEHVKTGVSWFNRPREK